VEYVPLEMDRERRDELGSLPPSLGSEREEMSRTLGLGKLTRDTV
jgi:hypothetical protein